MIVSTRIVAGAPQRARGTVNHNKKQTPATPPSALRAGSDDGKNHRQSSTKIAISRERRLEKLEARDRT
jgi:hypothetical protein